MRKTLFIFGLLLGLLAFIRAEDSAHNIKPKNGVLPDEVTAVAVAEPILSAIYGKDAIKKQKPLRAVLTNQVWVVTGTEPKGVVFGGVATIELSKLDGCVIRITHDR
jgi:hypothetical protein